MHKGIYRLDLVTPDDIAEYNFAELSRVFGDSLNHDSKALIVVQKLGDSPFRKSVVIGVPYCFGVSYVEKFPCTDEGISRYDYVKVLVVGPYAVNSSRLFVPKDCDDKEIRIPLKDIINFRRVELSDFLNE